MVLPQNEIFIGNVLEKINEKGKIIHQPTLEFIDKVIDNFLTWLKNVS